MRYSVLATDFVTKGVVVGAKVNACSFFDVDCATPLATGKTDPTGEAVLTINALPFTGYVEVSADGYLTQLTFDRPLVGDAGMQAGLVTPAAFEGIVKAADSTKSWDSKLGVVSLFMFDCFAIRAPGISYDVSKKDPSTWGFYFLNGFPHVDATQTDVAGWGGFNNVPTGQVDVSATRATTGEVVSSVGVLSRAGTITVVNLYPSPVGL
jgi:hypothetical protein